MVIINCISKILVEFGIRIMYFSMYACKGTRCISQIRIKKIQRIKRKREKICEMRYPKYDYKNDEKTVKNLEFATSVLYKKI